MSDANPVVMTPTEKTKLSLGKAAPWMMFMAVMGYIGCGVLALLGVGMALLGGVFSSLSDMGGMEEMGRYGRIIWPLIGILYIGLAALAFFPSLLLQRISAKSKAFGRDGSPSELEGVAVNMHSLARYWGICTIVMLSVYLLAAIGLIVALLAMALRF